MDLDRLRWMLRRRRLPLIRGGSPTTLAAASATVTAAVTVTSTTETIIATLPGISPPFASPTIRLLGWVNLSVGANATLVTLRFRRGTAITGTLVGVALTQTVAISTAEQLSHSAEDTPGEVANQQYVFTITQNTGPGNGTINLGEIQAYVY